MMKTALSVLFRISVLAFLLGGLAIVVLQIAGLAAGNGDFVESVNDSVGPWAYGASAVSGLLAFALSYFPQTRDDGMNDEQSAAHVHEHA
jgi:hypothetical protein